ncbi:MAG: alkaline phosphatase family protein [SAR324 cluster bacterium]|uniref:Alkaline phosphatase family protein n=1 Tax=SAR324 cluster bacterium TaxID=2024889 RepID=A0A7X9FTK4_9DELT|nr:alkaline phosphatase family protein [SAR324 cluster bacterium]
MERHRDRSLFLNSLINDSSCIKLLSQFPSTTAAHVTTLYTGEEVGQHGVYEWTYYEKRVDEVICALMFSYGDDAVAESNRPETLKEAGILPEKVLPEGRFLERLEKKGILTAYYCPEDFVNSSYNKRVCEHATPIAYKKLKDGLDNLAELNEQIKDMSFISFYYPGIDSVSHEFGPSSAENRKEIDAFLNALEGFLVKIRRMSDDTLILITADHGQIDVDPKETIYIDKRLPELSTWLVRNKQGKLLVPCGGERDLFLHVKPEYLDQASEILKSKLGEEALVIKTSDLIEEGFFGKQDCSDIFLRNVGNILVLPNEMKCVGWHENGRYGCHHRGVHGGLHEQEMEIPFIALL